jgi:hypothetical protein
MPNPEICSIEELELAIRYCPDQKAAKRLNIIHLLLCGSTFGLAQKHACITERCLQLWIVCCNSPGLNWHDIKPLHLPPYSPDYSPIERLWQHLISHYLAVYLTKAVKSSVRNDLIPFEK